MNKTNSFKIQHSTTLKKKKNQQQIKKQTEKIKFKTSKVLKYVCIKYLNTQ